MHNNTPIHHYMINQSQQDCTTFGKLGGVLASSSERKVNPPPYSSYNAESVLRKGWLIRVRTSIGDYGAYSYNKSIFLLFSSLLYISILYLKHIIERKIRVFMK